MSISYSIIYTREAARGQHAGHWEQEQECRHLLRPSEGIDVTSVVVREINSMPDVGESCLAVVKWMITDGEIDALAVVDLGLLTADPYEMLDLLATASERGVRVVTPEQDFTPALQSIEAIWKAMQSLARAESAGSTMTCSPVSGDPSNPLPPMQPHCVDRSLNSGADQKSS